MDRSGELPSVQWGTRAVLVGIALVLTISGVGLTLVVVAARLLGGQTRLELGAFSAAALVFYVAMFFVVWLLTLRNGRVSLVDLGYRPFPIVSGFGLAMSFLVVGLVITVLYAALLTALDLRWLLPSDQIPEFARRGAGATVFLALAAVVAPVAEETFFRGFVLPAMSQRLGFGRGLVVTSALFAVAHAQLGGAVPIFVLGLLLGNLYRLSGSIWPAILMHGANNALVVVATLLGPGR